ncbi:acyclic terpene utilization AtuA family protein [Gracilinema caldarium]|uniref:acyclic terpene utilization AtuA family protein n=1 Tax=Gracilinema caldarium TaxID=215591 RepID=UPI0026E9C6D8|nr:acyclic terpene utilization AtuA family protein [Gracilinema caldarium]
MPNQELRILSPTAILGYGFPEESFQRAVDRKPHVIAVDAGSSDPGPYYLGSGKAFTNRAFVKRDLRYMLTAGRKLNVPVIVGTAGGSGAAPHLQWCYDIILEIAREEELSFKMAVIPADVTKETVRQALHKGTVESLPFVPPLTEEALDSTTHLVAQLGPEPLVQALRDGADVVLAGRCYDPANFAALPLLLGYDEGLAIHMGKILECGAIAATPGSGADCAFATLTDHSFILEAPNPKRQFTVASAAAHTLYEKSNPYELPGPGGILDLRDCSFSDLGEGKVEVRGSRNIPTEPYKVKLEGARPVGYRSISIAGVRDPIMIASIDTILKQVSAQVQSMGTSSRGQVYFHVYGRDGVMGQGEIGLKKQWQNNKPYELGIVIESVAPTQEEAETLTSVTRSTLLHYGYEGRIATAGNLAFPFSPSDISMGTVYEFSVYHLMPISDPVNFPGPEGRKMLTIHKGRIQ